ncbi:MAG: farnesyl-diphosphate synthase [Deltaproteobacteria bacterium RIFOXYD12_FULL_57_12]|nr:MAG: farnesyl-diphosphate synthase [Deltaproteobacteria bacterium RIFOXYD12_FULL_57_12]
MDISDYISSRRARVEEALQQYMLRAEPPLTEHIEAMRYSLFADGKRVRPILCLAAAEAVMPTTDNQAAVLPAACALECIHTYSLIHDDLPAMDNDDLRRGNPTSHKVFGEAGAILAGDGLLTFAFELLSRPEPAGVPDYDRLRVILLISRAAGPLGMVGGQVLDLAGEGQQISLETLREIHSRKTGALITAAVQTGAILGGADIAGFQALTTYGEKIGLAFQIVDDLLNVEGTAEQLGKAVGSDAARQKATYPAFIGVAATRQMAQETATAAMEALAGFDHRAEPLRELARYIVNRKK